MDATKWSRKLEVGSIKWSRKYKVK
jgi:hypothetical protein